MVMEPLQMTPVKMSATSHLGETIPEPEVKTFGQYMIDALKQTNDLQKKSDAMNAALAAGEVDDISQVVIAGQKAEIALQLTMQVRNRALSAYQELMRMQV
ncbi:MAG: flagellar hook-basal body complex protein FliE [Schwartzia sp.]|nr:flagellar hook-basal body complex protein FliE [Schwartzia sp. (in: firmicutes)]MBP3691423.1 flagellar hook-basal body complex protein FliE [Schwartzia sp. (in: firmicutes)]MBQ4422053.1 flagellar hook-basal body complex protein FliE [Schwartzia sp. (in: firmicutes)]